MATYIVLMNFTDQGVRSVKESPNRFAAATQQAATMGVTVKQGFWTFGQYDLVVIAEGSDEAVAAWMYKIGSAGNVKSSTLRAFTEDEMRKIVGRL